MSKSKNRLNPMVLSASRAKLDASVVDLICLTHSSAIEDYKKG
ncbi:MULTISPECIES: hypothetical protein [unclassified Microcoleus]|nr:MULTISPECIES: hypothetical protein [unclassified Microcoleus]